MWGVCGVGDPFSMRMETIRKGDKLCTYIVSDLLLVNKRVLSANRISRQVYDLQCLLTCLTPFRDILSFLIGSQANSGLGSFRWDRCLRIFACEHSLGILAWNLTSGIVHSGPSIGILCVESWHQDLSSVMFQSEPFALDFVRNQFV